MYNTKKNRKHKAHWELREIRNCGRKTYQFRFSFRIFLLLALRILILQYSINYFEWVRWESRFLILQSSITSQHESKRNKRFADGEMEREREMERSSDGGECEVWDEVESVRPEKRTEREIKSTLDTRWIEFTYLMYTKYMPVDFSLQTANLSIELKPVKKVGFGTF